MFHFCSSKSYIQVQLPIQNWYLEQGKSHCQIDIQMHIQMERCNLESWSQSCIWNWVDLSNIFKKIDIKLSWRSNASIKTPKSIPSLHFKFWFSIQISISNQCHQPKLGGFQSSFKTECWYKLSFHYQAFRLQLTNQGISQTSVIWIQLPILISTSRHQLHQSKFKFKL